MHGLGIHILGDFLKCNRKILENNKLLKKIAVGAAKASNATIVDIIDGGDGVRVIIAESHISIVPVPEHELAYVEVFTCGDVINPDLAIAYLAEKLECKEPKINEFKRGILSVNNEKLPHKIENPELAPAV